MKIRVFIVVSCLLLIITETTYADRELSRGEILQIFQTLTAQSRNTWIAAGTIEATHQQYKASDGYFTNSNVVVRYDGDKFWWEINTEPQPEQANSQTEPRRRLRKLFDLDLNSKRIFAWDGEEYTMYFKSGKQAIVTENPNKPSGVGGPLTAGIIPWGNGIYTYQELSDIESSAVEVDVGSDKKEVRLTLKKSDTYEIECVLDPSKNYAVLSWMLKHTDLPVIVQTYEGYQLFADKWLPRNIIIERYDNSKKPVELFSYDAWSFDSIDLNQPHPDSFSVVYEDDTLIELQLQSTEKPLLYRSSEHIDTDILLQYKRSIIGTDPQTQNCATVAIEYIAAQLGRQINKEELAGLIHGPNEDTTLYELKQFTQQLGLNCLTVKTDVQTLNTLKEQYQVILHLTGSNHFVVLGHINDKYAWLIDLESSKFHYRIDIEEFETIWSDGIAMLISDKPLVPNGAFAEISDEQMSQIIGGTMVFDLECIDLIQEYGVIFCSEPISGLCGGCYTVFYNRWGCGEGEVGNTCTGDVLVGNASLACINDPEEPWENCITDEVWRGQYIRACQ
jgi:hypothetical protein